MLTVQDIGNKEVYVKILDNLKKDLPLGKRLFKRSIKKEEAMQLKKLNLQNVHLTDLNFLRYFPCLEELDISGSRVDNFEGVQYCRKLSYFAYYLAGPSKAYGICDFSFLQGLTELEELWIGGNRLEDVSVLAGLDKVNYLILEDNPIKTIEPLKKMQSLEQLEVIDCEISSLEGLEEFKALKTICLAGNHFTEEQKEEYHKRYPQIEIDFES